MRRFSFLLESPSCRKSCSTPVSSTNRWPICWLPPAVNSQTLIRLQELAAHLAELSELLEQQVGRDVE